MRKMLKFLSVVALAIPTLATAAEGVIAPPVALVELFTSQGCYSCPPAERVLAEDFAPRPDVAALELHVDYWDSTIWGGSSWADVFSNRDYTKRQTEYNIKIRDTRQVYTPQVIIQGRSQASGTQGSRIAQAVAEALNTVPEARFRFWGGENGQSRTVQVEGSLEPGVRLVYALFWRHRVTEIKRGENKDKTLKNTNVVFDLQRLPFGTREAKIPAVNAEQGCAVWLQRGHAGEVLSAARCPQV